MRLPHRDRTPRAAFTLVELLVVIAIIAILMGLTIAAVMRFLGKSEEVTAANDITQMTTALATFKQDFKVENPPSRLLLSNARADYNPVTPDDGNNALRQQSLAYLGRMFPRLDWNAGIDWTGAANPKALGPTILEGDQCLVFFLGGIQQNGACIGFSTNPRNPTLPGGTRKGPYFEGFQTASKRLKARTGPFLSFFDPFEKGQPYIYFSSGNRRNGYSAVKWNNAVEPYYRSANPKQYENPNTFQIISAGKNGAFGPGGQWDPSSGATGAGVDDLSNFTSDGRQLGAGAG
jgi:prepilin-type N-terminal cleavage/methylation domain-containing protein